MAPDGRNGVRIGPNGRQVAALGDRILISHHVRRLPPCRSMVTHESGSTRARRMCLAAPALQGFARGPMGATHGRGCSSPISTDRPGLDLSQGNDATDISDQRYSGFVEHSWESTAELGEEPAIDEPECERSTARLVLHSGHGKENLGHRRGLWRPVRVVPSTHPPGEAPEKRTGDVCWTSWTDVLRRF